MVKQLLREMGVEFELRDVTRDPAALAEFLRLGYRLPPVTVVGDVAVPGVDPERLESLLSES